MWLFITLTISNIIFLHCKSLKQIDFLLVNFVAFSDKSWGRLPQIYFRDTNFVPNEVQYFYFHALPSIKVQKRLCSNQLLLFMIASLLLVSFPQKVLGPFILPGEAPKSIFVCNFLFNFPLPELRILQAFLLSFKLLALVLHFTMHYCSLTNCILYLALLYGPRIICD